MNSGVLAKYVQLYPQLSLPIEEGMSKNDKYINIVQRGIFPTNVESPFIGSEQDYVDAVITPVGNVNVLVIGNRQDFVRFYQAIAYRCEPYPIPDSVGAACVFGVINWNKIHQHKKEFLACGGLNWSSGFKKFTSEYANYKDDLCIVSTGPYSNLEIESEGWLNESLTIRTWHEITHIVCRKLYAQNKDAVRDELVADMMGLLFAYGEYDRSLALRFLGIEDGKLVEGGRLNHYVTEDQIENAFEYAIELSKVFEYCCRDRLGVPPFEILQFIEENRIGIR